MFRSPPRASGYLHTSYGADLALLQTRTERVSLAFFAAILATFPFLASPFALDLACQVFLASIGALSPMLLTGWRANLARSRWACSGRFTTGIARNCRAVLDHAAGVGGHRHRAGLCFRPALLTASRPLSCGQHAGAAFRRHLYGRGIRNQAWLLDRHCDRAAQSRRHQARWTRLVFRPVAGRGCGPFDMRQPAAKPQRSRLAGHPRP